MTALLYDSILDCIGNTPLLHLQKMSPPGGADIYAKLESRNPGGASKDRVALAMIRAAEREGKLRPGGTLVEPSSGNTGIGLALAAAALGYRAVVVTPSTSRAIRRDTLRHLGAEVVETDPREGMAGAVKKAKELAQNIPGAFLPQQFQNPSNPEVHEKTTAKEILDAFSGRPPRAFVAGLGTGGTLTGVGRAFKQRDPSCQIISVEPLRAYNLPGGAGHCIEGIGVGFIPEVLDFKVIDEFIQVSEEEALAEQERLARTEGILVGPSSGAALSGALKVAQKLPAGAEVVVLFADTGERYFRARGRS